MSLILSIDTSLEQGAVCLSDGDHILALKRNDRQADHAAWLQPAIKDMLAEAGRVMKDLSAIAVTSGPGSYTGLRVGMSTAKGICYALKLPLITENTLLLTAQRVKKEVAMESLRAFPVLICPMIDARRMEVFTAVYDLDFNETLAPCAMILDENSYADLLEQHILLFCGNGSKKWQNLCMHTHAEFVDVTLNVADLAEIAFEKLKSGKFSDLAYTEPAYLKNFYTGKKQVD